ncbi:MAG: PAS domain S-box protein [Phycisphaerales bacterium]|nr:PAS domain S-box protein [Phycisphaerales bacterium]
MYGRFTPWRLTLVYALFGTLWIVASDRVAMWMFPTMAGQQAAQTFKGLLFIVLTSLLVYGLVRTAAHNLRISEERYRSVVNTMADALLVLENDGTILLVNRAFTEMYGYPSAEVIGTSAQRLIDPDHHHVFEEFVNQIRQEGHFRGGTIDVRKDGTRFHTEVTGARIHFGGRDCLLAVVRDVTQRVESEQALRAAEQFNREIIESAHEGIIAYDRELRYILWNPFMERLSGMPADAVLGRKAVEIFPRLADIGVTDLLERALAGEKVTAHDLPSPVPGQEERTWYSVTYAPRRDPGGRIIGVIGTVHDTTKRMQAERERATLEGQLRQAQKMEAIGQLAGGVAHNFNNILTAVLGNVELCNLQIRREIGADSPLLEYTQQIEQSAQRAAALTRQLLAFSRRQVSQPEVLDLNEVLRNLDKMLRRLVTENITVETSQGAALRKIRADVGHLEQVVVNLVVNAADAMSDGGRITIETANVDLDDSYAAMIPDTDPGPYVQLAVSDTGCGMDASVREHIFEPFFTTKPIDKGTGLGLATVYGIIKQAGGHISVYSEPDHGTTFKIYLPASSADATPFRSAEPREALTGGGETVLLCEDDTAVRDLTAQLLRMAGYTVITAGSGAEALNVAADCTDLDMLITDVIMPDINGRELCNMMRRTRPGLPALFISGYTANVIAHHGVLDDGVEFLEKPFTRQRLLERVREVLAARPAAPRAADWH